MKSLIAPSRTLYAAAAAAFMLACAAPSVEAKVAHANVVPANSPYVLSVPDVPAFWTAYKKNSLYAATNKVLEIPDIAKELEDAQGKIKDIETGLGFKLDGDTLSSIFKDLDVYINGGEKSDSVSAVIVAKVGDREKLNKILGLVEKASAEASKDDETTGSASTAVKVTKHNEVELRELTMNDDVSVHYGFVDDVFVVSSEEGAVHIAIDALKGTSKDGRLDSNDNYKKISGELPSAVAYFYSDPVAAMDLQKDDANFKMIEPFIAGLQPTSYSGSAVTIEEKAIKTKQIAVFNDKPESEKLRKLLTSAGDKLDITGYAPTGGLAVFATNIADLNLVYDAILTVAKETGGEGAESQLKAFESQVGFSIKDDFAGALGNQMELLVNNVAFKQGMPEVEAAIVFSVKDKAKLDKVLTAIDKFVKAQTGGESGGFKSEKVGEIDAKVFPLPMGNFAATFGVDGEFFILAPNVESLKKAAATKADKTKQFVNSEEAKSLGVATQGIAFTHLNLAGIITTVSGIMREMGSAGPEAAQITDILKVLKGVSGVSYTKDNKLYSDSALNLN
jgi:hypothetical protein